MDRGDELWANPWGLHGVGGNVEEACVFDHYSDRFGAWRGGSWFNSAARRLRCANRVGVGRARRSYYGGFRLALALPQP